MSLLHILPFLSFAISSNGCQNKPSLPGADWIDFDRSSNSYSYTCAEGYLYSNPSVLRQSSHRPVATCHCISGSWAPSVCTKMCPTPPPFSNGQYLNTHCSLPSFSSQTICKYACHEGFTPGKDSLQLSQGGRRYAFTQCVEGEWISPPHCLKQPPRKDTFIHCRDLEPERLMPGSTLNCPKGPNVKQCSFKCPPGYLISDVEGEATGEEGVVKCLGGHWVIPNCQPSCKFPQTEAVGKVIYLSDWCTTEAVANGRCFFNCPAGYALNPSLPVEVMDGSNCGVLQCGQKVTTPCQKIDQLQPPSRTCHLPEFDLTSIAVSPGCRGPTVSQGEECAFQCLNGFFEGSTLKSFTARCNGAEWLDGPRDTMNGELLERTSLRCTVGCPPLEIDPSANIQGGCSMSEGNHEGSKCVVSCPGNTLRFSSSPQVAFSCVKGSWVYGDGQILDCPVQCSPKPKLKPLPAVPHCRPFAISAGVQRSCGTVHSVVTCHVWCKEVNLKPFDLPELSVSCTVNGWIAFNPATGRQVDLDEHLSCQRKCPPLSSMGILPAITPNCEMDRRLPSHKRCQLICPQGVFNEGQSNVQTVCSDGQWNLPVSRCVVQPPEKRCAKPPSIQNGLLTGKGCLPDVSQGTKCTFSCATGFAAQPMSASSCECNLGEISCVDGAWEIPLCRPKTDPSVNVQSAIQRETCVMESVNSCGSLPSIRNGHFTGTKPPSNGLPQKGFVCSSGFFAVIRPGLISDESSVDCVRGKWQKPICLTLSIAIEESETPKVNLRLYHSSPKGIADATVLDSDGKTWKAVKLENSQQDGNSTWTTLSFSPLDTKEAATYNETGESPPPEEGSSIRMIVSSMTIGGLLTVLLN